MKIIENYNSSYPLAYYEIGTVYSFYGRTSIKGSPATKDQIYKFASVLNELVLKEQDSIIKSVKSENLTLACKGGIDRFYAVVVDKLKSEKNEKIVVMFCNKYNDRLQYYIKKYSVNVGCITDGKDLMPVSTHLSFESKSNEKMGGVTLVTKEKKVGTITRVNEKNVSTTSIGGITKINGLNNQITGSINTEHERKVGGVTLVKEQKVGGVTLVKEQKVGSITKVRK